MMLRRGDRVLIVYRKNDSYRGTVMTPGPEQSEVRLDGERQARVYVNSDLAVIRKRVKANGAKL